METFDFAKPLGKGMFDEDQARMNALMEKMSERMLSGSRALPPLAYLDTEIETDPLEARLDGVSLVARCVLCGERIYRAEGREAYRCYKCHWQMMWPLDWVKDGQREKA